MDVSMMIELFGYLGSTLVVVSMLMASVVKLRVINMIGSIISGTYALIIGSFPLALMNFSLIVINAYNLIRLLKSDKQYDLVDGTREDGLLHYFLRYYGEDIKKYFPEFSGDIAGADKAYVVCCNGNPAGVMLGQEKTGGELEVMIDYSTPAYRDCSIGTYLYSKLPSKGIRTLTYSGEESEKHVLYLTKMGFVRENDAFVKKLG